jgi:uncharacterized protein YjbI with pentapeptide repeats
MTMQTRPGFARLLPLVALTGSAAGILALFASAGPPARSAPARTSARPGASRPGVDFNIVDHYARVWQLAEIPAHRVRGLILPNAAWQGADLHRATLLECDFTGADLRRANLRGTRLVDCRLEGADLRGADLTGAVFSGATFGTTFDNRTLWPKGFNPEGEGARWVHFSHDP